MIWLDFFCIIHPCWIHIIWHWDVIFNTGTLWPCLDIKHTSSVEVQPAQFLKQRASHSVFAHHWKTEFKLIKTTKYHQKSTPSLIHTTLSTEWKRQPHRLSGLKHFGIWQRLCVPSCPSVWHLNSQWLHTFCMLSFGVIAHHLWLPPSLSDP